MASKSFDKLIEEIGNMSVLDLADLVKELETKFGVSAAMSMSAGAAAPAAGAAEGAKEEKSTYKVTLTDGGAEKLKSIKALRTVTTLGLAEAKKAVEDAAATPFVIAESASKADAQKMKEAMEAAGAKVQLS